RLRGGDGKVAGARHSRAGGNPIIHYEETDMPHNSFNTLKSFTPAPGKTGQYYSLPALAQTFPNVKRLPVSIRVVLESVLLNVDDKKVTEEHVKRSEERRVGKEC